MSFVGESRLLVGGTLSGHAPHNLRHKALEVCGKSFEALLRDLQEKAVHKSSGKLRNAIQHLCFFDADPALLQTMVNLIAHGNINASDKEGRVVLRLAHYFASSLPPPSTLATMQTKVVAKEVAHRQLSRRVFALRTLSVSSADSDVRTDLQGLVREILAGVHHAVQTGGARSRTKDAVEHACLQHACMAAIRQRPQQLLLDHAAYLPSSSTLSSLRSGAGGGRARHLDRAVVDGVLYATGCADPVGARHAVALLREVADEDAEAVAAFVTGKIPDHFRV